MTDCLFKHMHGIGLENSSNFAKTPMNSNHLANCSLCKSLLRQCGETRSMALWSTSRLLKTTRTTTIVQLALWFLLSLKELVTWFPNLFLWRCKGQLGEFQALPLTLFVPLLYTVSILICFSIQGGQSEVSQTCCIIDRRQ